MISVLSLKNHLLEHVMGYIPWQYGEVIWLMVLGETDEYPQHTSRALQAIGMSHISSVSGFNISVLAQVLRQLLTPFFKSRFLAVLLIASVWVYAWLVEFTPSIVRASLMFSLAMVAKMAFRQLHLLFVFCWCFLSLAFCQTQWLSSLSFQLSFAATAAIISLKPVFFPELNGQSQLSQLWIGLEPSPTAPNFYSSHFRLFMNAVKEYVVETAQISLVIQLVTWPLVISCFQQWPPISLLANFVLLWLVPILTVMGMGLILLANLLKNNCLLVMAVSEVTSWLIIFFQQLVRFLNLGADWQINFFLPLWTVWLWWAWLAYIVMTQYINKRQQKLKEVINQCQNIY